jgi:AcrR family transcriptional regulator
MVPNLNSGSNGHRSERKAMKKRRAILQAAATTFRKRGFAATGMREIAEAADLSPANLYYYFGSKQELLFFCQDHSLDRMLAACRAEQRRRNPPAEKLRRVISEHLKCTLDELDGAAAHLEVDALPASMRNRVVGKRDRYERAIRRIIAEGIRKRAFIPVDAALVSRAILGALNWTARWYRPDGPVPPQVVADTYASYLVRGLKA